MPRIHQRHAYATAGFSNELRVGTCTLKVVLAADAGALGLWHGRRSGCTPQLHPWGYKGWCPSYRCPIASLQTSDRCRLQGSFQHGDRYLPHFLLVSGLFYPRCTAPSFPVFFLSFPRIPSATSKVVSFGPNPLQVAGFSSFFYHWPPTRISTCLHALWGQPIAYKLSPPTMTLFFFSSGKFFEAKVTLNL